MTEDREKEEKIRKIKKIKTLKTLITACGGAFPFILIFFLCLAVVVAAMLPVFFVTTMEGGKTIYSGVELPSEVLSVSEWSEEDRAFFDIISFEKRIVNERFSYYKERGMLLGSSEIDISLPIAITQYRGTVNLMAFDDTYPLTGTNADDKYKYESEKNVQNWDTKDFYAQASKTLGNTFSIFPGQRMLLGNMLRTPVSWYQVEYKIFRDKDGNVIGDNSSDIIYAPGWTSLGKITSSGSSGAFAERYLPIQALDIVTEALAAGNGMCKGGNSNTTAWERANACYDLPLMEMEIFGATNVKNVVAVLERRYRAIVPIVSLIEGKYYLVPEVHKELDNDLLKTYLREVYIPYIYINCDDCGYKESSTQEARDKIYDEMMLFINSFKTFNNSELIDTESMTQNLISNGGTLSLNGVEYKCETTKISVSSDYCNSPGCKSHNANDISGVHNANIYPLFQGEVVAVNSSCHSLCPTGDAMQYINKVPLNMLSPACSCGGGFGNYVKIKGEVEGETIYATYAHMSSVKVSVGDKVDMTTVLGITGSTGVSTGEHLHIEFNYNENNSSTKFPATRIFTQSAVASAVCKRTSTL